VSAPGSSGNLTLRMRAVGSAATRAAVASVKQELRSAGDETNKNVATTNAYTRAIRLMTTRTIIATFAVGGLGLALAATSPAIAMLLGATATFAAIFIPAFILGVAVVQRFGQSVDVAGTAAFALSAIFKNLQAVWAHVFAGPADTILWAVAAVMQQLIPIVSGLGGPLQVFARYIAQAIMLIGQGLMPLLPQLAALFPQFGQLALLGAHAIVPLATAFLLMARDGIPTLRQLLEWFVALTQMLPGAVNWVNQFLHSVMFWAVVHTVFTGVADGAKYLAGVIANLAGIAWQLYNALKPLYPIVGAVLLTALQALAGAIALVNHHFGILAPLLPSLVTGFVAFKLAMWGVQAATWASAIAMGAWEAAMAIFTALSLVPEITSLADAWFLLDAAMDANPIGVIILAIGGLTAAVVVLITHLQQVKDLLNSLQPGSHFSKKHPIISGAARGAAGAAYNIVPGGGAVAHALHLPGAATGGYVRSGGTLMVGEQGAELVHLPSGSRVEPQRPGGGFRSASDSVDYVASPVTLMTPNYEVLATGIARVGVRRRSTR
jgi:hypothetical protein